MCEAEERRLDKLKAYTAAEGDHNLGQKQAALVEKAIQGLFALASVWEIRRMKPKARVASIIVSFVSSLNTHQLLFSWR